MIEISDKGAEKVQEFLASQEADVSMAAKTHLLATAAGAYLKLEGGDIELGAPGKVEFKGSQRELTGAASASGDVQIQQGQLKSCSQQLAAQVASGTALV